MNRNTTRTESPWESRQTVLHSRLLGLHSDPDPRRSRHHPADRYSCRLKIRDRSDRRSGVLRLNSRLIDIGALEAVNPILAEPA
jgi:hypothetical protein